MLKLTLLLPTALASVLAVPAPAQTVQPSTTQQTRNAPAATASPAAGAERQSGFLARQAPSEWRGSKLIGASVYGPDDKSIGDINELIVGPKGEVRAVVIGVGGFLGIGEKNVAVPFQALHVTRKPNTSSVGRITASLTKDDLQKAPRFAYLKANGANNTTASGLGQAPGNPAPARQ
jgi:hypothetical protein